MDSDSSAAVTVIQETPWTLKISGQFVVVKGQDVTVVQAMASLHLDTVLTVLNWIFYLLDSSRIQLGQTNLC